MAGVLLASKEVIVANVSKPLKAESVCTDINFWMSAVLEAEK
jgi:hypothetical protein